LIAKRRNFMRYHDSGRRAEPAVDSQSRRGTRLTRGAALVPFMLGACGGSVVVEQQAGTSTTGTGATGSSSVTGTGGAVTTTAATGGVTGTSGPGGAFGAGGTGGALGTSASSTSSSGSVVTSWNLATDFGTANLAGSPWTLGYYSSGNNFVQFTTFNTNVTGGGPTWSWTAAPGSYPDIWLSDRPEFDYGILPGNVSLHADLGTPVARWTAPYAGVFSIRVQVGGSLESGPDGYGNQDANLAGLRLNGVEQPSNAATQSATNNMMTWSLSGVTLSQGGIVDVYVGQQYGGGNTNAVLAISGQ
jgi:hypothetical protein